MTSNPKENNKVLVNIDSQLSDIVKQIIADEVRSRIRLLIKNKCLDQS